MSSQATSNICQWQSSLRHYPMFVPNTRSNIPRTREDLTRKVGSPLSGPHLRQVVKETLRVPDKASCKEMDGKKEKPVFTYSKSNLAISTPLQQSLLTTFHTTVLCLIAEYLNCKELVKLGEVSRLFNGIANTKRLWNCIAAKILHPAVLRKSRDLKKEVIAFSKLSKPEQEEFAFVTRIVGHIKPTFFAQMPEIVFFRPSTLHSEWTRPVPVVRGAMWDDGEHLYQSILAFSIFDRIARHTQIIIVKDKPGGPSSEKIEYLARLIKG